MLFCGKTRVFFMRLLPRGDSTQAEWMRIVEQRQDKTLDEIHLQERLDYLRHQVRKLSKSEKSS